MKEDGTVQPAKVTHFTQSGYTIKGLIHGGANDGEEVYSYRQLGIENIICFEPLTAAHAECNRHHPDVPCFEMALSDTDGQATLQIATGDGKGSSLLDTIEDHPEVERNWNQGQQIIVGTTEVKTTRLDTFFKDYDSFNIEDYDCLVLDTQGNELEVLIGAGALLQNFKFLSVELSTDPVYRGEHPGAEVATWLVEQGFTQDTPLQSHNDVFFVRSDIKPSSDLVYRGLA